MKRLALSIVVSIVTITAMAVEQVNKCTDETGKVVYQKDACETTQRGEQKQIDPDRNAVKMELPPPSEKPTAKTAPAQTPPARRPSY